MDKDSESFDNDSAAKIGALFNGVRTTCGSLRDPPYKNHTEMLCIACTHQCVIGARIKALTKLVLFTLLFPNKEQSTVNMLNNVSLPLLSYYLYMTLYSFLKRKVDQND